jgi:hypothetical protein
VTNVIVSSRQSDGFTSIDFFARISSSITATIRPGVYRSFRPPDQRTPLTQRVHHVCDQQYLSEALSEALSPATIYLYKIKSSLAIKGRSLITALNLHLTESTRTSSFQSASISKAPQHLAFSPAQLSSREIFTTSLFLWIRVPSSSQTNKAPKCPNSSHLFSCFLHLPPR